MARDLEWLESTFEPTSDRDIDRDTLQRLKEQYRRTLELRLQPVCSSSPSNNSISARSRSHRSVEPAHISGESLH